MSAIKSQHSRVFERLVQEQQAKLTDALVAGTAVDHLAYRQLVGRLQGLADALKLSEEADHKLSGEEPNGSG